MGTKDLNIKKYKDLWDIFENLLQKDGLNLSSFAKKWEKYHEDETADYKKFYEKIKQRKKRNKSLTHVQSNSIIEMEEYIKFLDNGYFTQELLEDEKPNSWFC